VTAVTRRPDAFPIEDPRLRVAGADALDAAAVDGVVAGHNRVISALGVPYTREPVTVFSRGAANIVAAQDGIRRLLGPARDRLPRLSYLWADAGYRGRGKDWAERELGVEVEVVNRSPKPTPEKVLSIWAREWFREGREMDLKKPPKRPGFENLPRRWVAERTFAWISHNRRMAKDCERLCSAGEAFIHAAMTRLMVRRLARA
jgi:transposase